MRFKDIKIHDCINDINQKYYIPIFQRQLEWSLKDIKELFDSIMKDYYIGSLLFWSVDRDAVTCYKFIDSYIPETIHPENLDGIYSNNLTTIKNKQIDLIVDGQQRLNSLYLGLNSSVWDRQKGKKRKNIDSWNKKYLYLNLNKNPLLDESDSKNFEFQFRKEGGFRGEKIWYKVPDIMDVSDIFNEIESTIETAKQEGVKNLDRKCVERTLQKLYNKVHDEKILAYYQLDNHEESQMHEIFIRINESGSQLSNEDKIISESTPIWYNRDKLLPREEFESFGQKLNKKYKDILSSYKFDSSEMVKYSYNTKELEYTSSLSKEECIRILEYWKNDEIQESLETLCNILLEYNLKFGDLNKTELRFMFHIIFKLQRNNVKITTTIKEDLIDLFIIFHFNKTLFRQMIFNAINRVEIQNEVPIKKIDQELDSGLKFNIDNIIDNIEDKRIGDQTNILRLFNKKIDSSSQDYKYKYTDLDGNPIDKSILNRDYSNSTKTQIITQERRKKQKIEKERKKLKQKIDKKFIL